MKGFSRRSRSYWWKLLKIRRSASGANSFPLCNGSQRCIGDEGKGGRASWLHHLAENCS